MVKKKFGFSIPIILLLFVSILFINCKNTKAKDMASVEKVAGNWEWAYTKGNENGEVYHVTPDALNMSIQYNFTKDSVLIFINNSINEVYPYEFSGDTLSYGQEKVIYEVSSSRDSLFLRNSECCDDVFEKLFIKIID